MADVIFEVDNHKITISEEDASKVLSLTWTTDNINGYVRCGRKRLHNFILDYYGPLEVDHINRDIYDNRRVNLRLVTHRQNKVNSDNHWPNPCVTMHPRGKTWNVQIRYNGKQHYKGRFKTEEEAVIYRDRFMQENNIPLFI